MWYTLSGLFTSTDEGYNGTSVGRDMEILYKFYATGISLSPISNISRCHACTADVEMLHYKISVRFRRFLRGICWQN